MTHRDKKTIEVHDILQSIKREKYRLNNLYEALYSAAKAKNTHMSYNLTKEIDKVELEQMKFRHMKITME